MPNVSSSDSQNLWIVICSFVAAAAFTFGLGANECANVYATSVGSGVLKKWQAYALASIFETLGAGLLGIRFIFTVLPKYKVFQ